MKYCTIGKIFLNSFTLITILSFNIVLKQTSSLIYQAAAGGVNIVIDPNGDGYTSITPIGFIIGDQGQSVN